MKKGNDEIGDLKVEIMNLRDVLRFYADRDNWTRATAISTSHMVGENDHDFSAHYACFHGGAKARRVLNKKGHKA